MPSMVRSKRKTPSVPKELQAFCKRLGITRYVPVALRLLEECFPRKRDLKMYPEIDPGSGEEWLVVAIRVPGTAEQVRKQYYEYTSRKIESIPVEHIASIRLMHCRI